MEESKLTRESFMPPEPSGAIAWLVGAGIAAAMLVISVALMKWSGLLDLPKDATGGTRIAAALALIGSVLTASVTLLGTVVKFAIDDRTARLAKLEADRNYALALEGDKRNRIDTAIRAVDLLSDDNQNSTPHQIGGALLALVSLGEHDLAVSLLEQLWPSNLAAPTVAQGVLAAALESGVESTQTKAALVIFQNAARIQVDKDVNYWPLQPKGWRNELPLDVRIGLVLAVGKWLKASVELDRNRIPDPATVLYRACDDADDRIRDIAAAGLRPVIAALTDDFWIYNCGEVISIADMRKKIETFGAANSNNAMELELELSRLYAETEPQPAPLVPAGDVPEEE